MVWVVLHTVLLVCVLWLMNLKKTPQPSKYCFPRQNLSCSRQFLKWAIWISHYLALLILSFPRKQQWPKG